MTDPTPAELETCNCNGEWWGGEHVSDCPVGPTRPRHERDEPADPVLDTAGPMSAVVFRPNSPHWCRMVPDIRNREIKIPGGTATVPMADFDPPGTVRACTDCGRTWVSYRFPPQGGYAAGYDIRWRREGRLARWWRERRQRPAAAQRRERSEPPK